MTGAANKITIVIMIVALMGSVTLLSGPNMNISAQENMTNIDQNMTNTDQNMTAMGSGTISGSGKCC